MTDLTIAIDSATDNALERAAKASHRSKAEIAAEALASYMRDQAELEAMVREARDDFAAGRIFNDESVAEGVRKIIEAARTA
jgi:predicted transcriptional regulator